MNKLFGLFLLALAFLAPGVANAATCFWVGGTGSWDGTNTGGGGAGGIKWASASGGGTTCAGAGTGGSPGAADNATFDAASGGGTVTVNTTVALTNLTAGAFTGTLDFATNNNDVTATIVSFTGTGARTINMGSGTWTITSTAGATPFDVSTTTNLTASFASANIVYSAAASPGRGFSGGGQSYGSLTINNNSTNAFINVSGANTFGSITVGSGTNILFPQGITNTITGALNITGTSSAPSGLQCSGPTTNVATVSVGSASTCVWCGVFRITKAGAGSITATNSLDLGGNTGVTITAPSGGGGSSRCIGC